ncbi:hemerythrin domain-containing protein [Hydrogenophaga pseudoflava]|uniref:hemerythrin domain-containing protein n=1 Tax=Hydrogenophaga pseudoflava TaxID=47421 RepID=UPI0027E41A51|nr:hemerythrin domain-containing protein [Hydrogenophaga pseudoflava]MDQ7744369.1 hemerythrin domain-containing protein [Hydrogenophaga pseudoflava]
MNATSSVAAAVTPDPTEAVTLLVNQHRRLEALLSLVVEEAAPPERTRRLLKAADELAVHIAAEEMLFYPAVRAERTEDILLESLEEHLSLKRLLADLLALDPVDCTFTPKCKVLLEQTEHHHEEEEDHLFPKVMLLLGPEKRAELGRQMLQQQTDLMRAGEPREWAAEQTEAAQALDEEPTPRTEHP